MELLVTLMLQRGRQLPMSTADGVQPAQFGAAVAALPSGLLEMVGMAIMALESKLVVT